MESIAKPSRGRPSHDLRPRGTLPEVVDVVPVCVVPAGQEPDVALALRHALLEGLAHRHARRPLEELADDDARPAPLQVLQVLQKEGFNALTLVSPSKVWLGI